MTERKFEVYDVLKTEIDVLRLRMEELEGRHCEFRDKFILLEARKSLVEFASKNWWKLLFVSSPIIIGVGELMVYLRNLPTN